MDNRVGVDDGVGLETAGVAVTGKVVAVRLRVAVPSVVGCGVVANGPVSLAALGVPADSPGNPCSRSFQAISRSSAARTGESGRLP